ncbi:hypothetical protein [Brevibacillus daliensis]|uniref:hypothetical protein n=1 Tax=Brevibacillus daliensis TaxID=2892995 RepID=UPI001E577415|nr:hypothetical protein [Brevibacillus daliensis]
MNPISYELLIQERMNRQGLLQPLMDQSDEAAYLALFKRLQPVSPVHNTRPGDPPSLVHRTAFRDYQISSKLREKHLFVKGRFLGGRVGYVLQEDLHRYATVFRKPITKPKGVHHEIMSLIKQSGGISKEQLKEELPYPKAAISKELKTLQEAFILYEEQTDTDWDTGLFDFATEFFELPTNPAEEQQAISQVLLSFLSAMVAATLTQIKDWSQLKTKTLQTVLDQLVDVGQIHVIDIPRHGTHYIRTDEPATFPMDGEGSVRSVFMLDLSDYLVRAHMSELKERYKEHEVLQYLLIDGEIKGAVLGHWRIGPYDVDDVLVELDESEKQARKNEILEAIRVTYPPEETAIIRYDGEMI